MTSAELLLELLKALIMAFLFASVLAMDIAGVHMILNMFLTGRKTNTSLDSAERRRLARWFWWPFTVFFVAWIVLRVYALVNGEHIDLEHGL
jgi:hypothetical protein